MKTQLMSLMSVVFCVMLASCTTLDPYTNEKKVSNAAKGAGVGVLLGAAIGAATAGKDKKKAALTGAAIGGLAGLGAGVYMDNQAEKLRQRLQGTGVSVTRVGDNIRLNMPGNVTFATNSSDIRGQFEPVLDSVGIVINEFNETNVRITGYTDSTGSDSYNQQLSEQRAASVRSFLAGRGVVAGRLFSQGMGERNPIASNETQAGREQNRRVEIELIPLKS